MISQKYFFKIIILSVANFAGIFLIWYFLIRPEGADWLVAQVAHQASPYAVISDGYGKLTVDNVVDGYEFELPSGFKTNGARNLILYLESAGGKNAKSGIRRKIWCLSW